MNLTFVKFPKLKDYAAKLSVQITNAKISTLLNAPIFSFLKWQNIVTA